MPSILSLPVEIISYVTRDLDIQDLSAFSRSCRAICGIVSPQLYRLVKDEASLMCWAVDEGHIGTVERLLVAGANPNIAWVQTSTRSTVLTVLEACKPSTRLFNSSRRYGSEPPFDRIHVSTDPDDSDSMISFSSSEDDDDDDDSYYYYDSDLESEVRSKSYENHGDLASHYYWMPLHIAARWGNDKIVDLLLKYGADVNALSRGFCNCILPKEGPRMFLGADPVTPIWTPLHTAICHGHESTARLLISRGASINVSPRLLGSDPRHITALHAACYSDLVSVSRFLIDEGYQTDVDVQDHAGSTPLSYAYFAGNWRSIDFLVEMGASLNATLGPFTLLKHACYEDRFAEALRFIELGVDIAASFEPSGKAESILHCCCMPVRPSRSPLYHRESCQEHLRTEVVRTVIKAGADLEVRDKDMMTPLMKAALVNVDGVVRVLLDEGADIDARDDVGDTALLKACRPSGMFGMRPEGAMLRTVEALLERIPPNTDMFDALERVCGSCGPSSDKAEAVRLLVHHGGPATLEPKGAHLLLTRALISDNVGLCDTLLECGSREPTPSEIEVMIDKIIAQDNSLALEYMLKFPHGREILLSPSRLLDTIKKGKSDCALSLIDAGAPVCYHSDDDESCLIEACKLEDPDVAELLLQSGADPNEPVGGIFALTYPILNENLVMVELLLDHGADMHEHHTGTEDDGRTFGPLDLAIFFGLIDVVETMVKHPSFLDATKEERAAHLQMACCADPAAYGNGSILEILLDEGNLNANVVFTRENMTPLHISIALNRLNSIEYLLHAGADMHYYLRPAEPPVQTRLSNTFEGSTPLEWAILNAPIEAVKALVYHCCKREPFTDEPETMLRYVRAACRRHNPEIMQFVTYMGLDPYIFDEEGNSFPSIFCQTIDKIWPLEEPDWPAATIAARSAKCIVILLGYQDRDLHKKNAKGVSTLDHIRRMMTYEGPSEFHQEVAKWWNRELILDDEIGVRTRSNGLSEAPWPP
ncbi:ankyrin [Annulohypoxylon truncatum]|uniref:ankyrin n=1 Tax=Annulohypoxylon truncatum TaxID=327061 RepID=UPI00200840B9|nr:ankyrin [Annulohypoxylon truncatum]KAI1206793.1 ankyrin [Annulohypoxylon truncatum]